MAATTTTSRPRPVIVGLSWKKLKNAIEEDEEDDIYQSPITRSQARASARYENLNGAALKDKVLTRVRSVRASIGGIGESFGTLRQKLKKSTQRRKRLTNAMSPKTPTPSKARSNRRRTLMEMTPRQGNQQELQMYSPFCIDTPSKTPSKIKMGTKSPKRVYMSSPGTFQKDLDAVSEGMKTLTQMGETIGQQRRTRRSSMGVSSLSTPQRSARQKPIFV